MGGEKAVCMDIGGPVHMGQRLETCAFLFDYIGAQR